MSIKSFFAARVRYLGNRRYAWALISSIALFVIALVANYYASTYASNHVSTPVGDLFLSNIGVVSVSSLFVYSSAVFWVFSMLVYVAHLQRLPFTLKTSAFFVIVRAVFINLTWIGPFPDAVSVHSSGLFSLFSFTGDLFFSGHTGFPLLMAFIFWDSKVLRFIFIAWSLFFAVVVLLGHIHYTIDVLSAFFITYTIFHLSQVFLGKDFRTAKEGLPK